MRFNRGMTTKVSLSNTQDKRNKLEASEPGHRTVYSAWSSSGSQNASVVDQKQVSLRVQGVQSSYRYHSIVSVSCPGSFRQFSAPCTSFCQFYSNLPCERFLK